MEHLEQEKGTFKIKCSLGEVGFEVISLNILDLAKVRIFLPNTLEGVEFYKELKSRIFSAWEKSGYDPSLLKSPLYNYIFNLIYGGFIRRRKFNLDTLDYSATFKEIKRFAKLQSTSRLEKMLAMVDETEEPTAGLFGRAIFTEPDYVDSRLDKITYQLGFYLASYVLVKERERKYREDNFEMRILQKVDYLVKEGSRIGTEVGEKVYGKELKRLGYHPLPKEFLEAFGLKPPLDIAKVMVVGKIGLLVLDGEFRGFLGYVFRELYRPLRESLTIPERRLFQFLYFPQRALENRIIAMVGSEAIQSFLDIDDKVTKTLLLKIVFKRKILQGKPIENHLGIPDLEEIWRRFLRFYPCWVEIIRMDEIDRYREKINRRRLLSYDIPINTKEKTVSLKDRIPSIGRDPLTGLILTESQEEIEKVLTEFCTDLQKKCIKMWFWEGLTEEEIGRFLGISHQAVSKHIKRGLLNIKRGLEEGVQENLMS